MYKNPYDAAPKKIVLIGFMQTGRTALLYRLKQSKFFHNAAIKTISVDYFSKKIKGQNKLIPDMTQQTDFFRILLSDFQDSSAILIVVDQTKKQTLDDIDGFYALALRKIKQQKEKIPLILILTKSDLINDTAFTLNDVIDKALTLNIDVVIETSSMYSINLTAVEQSLVFLTEEQSEPKKLYLYRYQNPQQPLNCAQVLLKEARRRKHDGLPLFLPNAEWHEKYILPKSTTYRQYPYSPERPKTKRYKIVKYEPRANDLCDFCLCNRIDTIFKSCGHRFACSNCMTSLRIQNCSVCQTSASNVFDL